MKGKSQHHRVARIWRRIGGGLVLVLLCLVIAGCVSSPSSNAKSAGASPFSPTDACAMRLHDLCGPLLMYYAINHALPPKIEDLAQFSDLDEPPKFTCPVSKLRYIYNPKGILAPGGMGKIIIYDATPVHSGIRWGIAIIEPQRRNDALVARVIAVPDSVPTGTITAAQPSHPAGTPAPP